MIGTGILLMVIAVLSAFLLMIKKEMRSIKQQLHERRKGRDQPIEISLINKEITALACEINEMITAQKEQRIELLNGERRLKEAVSNISHDLRTPLTSIIGYLQLLQRTDLTTEQREFVETILSRSKDLRHLIRDFYDLSVWEEKEKIAQLKKINLDIFLENSILTYAEQFAEKGMAPQITSLEGPVFVNADEAMLKRIVDNLISNALYYGQQRFHVTVSTDHLINVSFQNDLSEEQVIDTEKLFDQFYRADLSRDTSGTGLGLYIVRRLMDKMAGNVQAKIEMNSFTVTLSFSTSAPWRNSR